MESISPTPLRIAITGASGLIGSAVREQLERSGHEVIPLVRHAPASGTPEARWDPATGEIDEVRLDGIDGVIYLAGENVGEPWTEERKARIRSSRVDATRLLAEHLVRLPNPPRVFVSASAIGVYGDRGDEVLDEESAPGEDFLAGIVRDWEAAAAPAEAAGIRTVHLRFGVVLSTRGGALERLLLPFRLGIGGRLGSGRQWMSWVTLADVVDVVCFALKQPDVTGALNVTAPNPVTNAEFARRLAHALHRPAWIPVPAAALHLIFGQMADDTILASQRAVPRRLQTLGYRFRHPELDEALRAVLRAKPI